MLCHRSYHSQASVSNGEALQTGQRMAGLDNGWETEPLPNPSVVQPCHPLVHSSAMTGFSQSFL